MTPPPRVLIYPVYYHLVEQDEAEARSRDEWIEELAARWGLVRVE
jgi:hypothetical protein